MTQSQFEALPPVADVLSVAGEVLEITPLKVGELPAFARAVQPLAGKLTTSAAQPDWWQLLAEDGQALLLALSIAARRPLDWVAALAVDDAIRLAEAVFSVNADFFILRVAPEIARVGQQIQTRLPGAASSPSYSGPDTATATS